jgi:hypothetical protein
MADPIKPAPTTAPAASPSAKADRQPAPVNAPAGTPATSSTADVAAFVQRMKDLAPVAAAGVGRLIFAMDATMSRQPTWDLALGLQAGMFDAVKAVGGLDVQLVYFRGAGECRASRWVRDPDQLARLMTRVACQGGYTQIEKVIVHARSETASARVNALVYVGDSMEEEVDVLCGRAGELAMLGVPVFLFQEGADRAAGHAFAEIARLTRGAHCRFDAGAADQLRALLTAVAVYAAGGRKALERLGTEPRAGAGARKLLGQMR